MAATKLLSVAEIATWLDPCLRVCPSAWVLHRGRGGVIRGGTWCRLRRKDDDRTWRMVVRRIWRDGEELAWLAAVIISPWSRVLGWAWAHLLGSVQPGLILFLAFMVLVLIEVVFGSGFQISNKSLLYRVGFQMSWFLIGI